MKENFVNINEYIPNLIIDVRYFSGYNFVGSKIEVFVQLRKEKVVAYQLENKMENIIV